MRTSMIAVVVAAAVGSGCMVLPRTKRELVSKRVERVDARVEELGLALTAGRISGRTISARAIRSRWCRSAGREITEYKVSKGARLSVPDGGGSDLGAAFLMLFSVYTLPISGIVTGAIVAASDTRTEQQVTALPDEGAACDLPAAGVSVWLAVNGAELVHATTDADGVARFAVERDVGRGEALMGIDGITPPAWQPDGRPAVRAAEVRASSGTRAAPRARRR